MSFWANLQAQERSRPHYSNVITVGRPESLALLWLESLSLVPLCVKVLLQSPKVLNSFLAASTAKSKISRSCSSWLQARLPSVRALNFIEFGEAGLAADYICCAAGRLCACVFIHVSYLVLFL